MHSYSIDSSARRTVHYALALLAAAVPGAVTSMSAAAHAWYATTPIVAWPLSMGGTFGLLYFVWDRFVWKWPGVVRLHGVPNLNGRWDGHGVSSYDEKEDGTPGSEFSLSVTIRQTFSMVEIFGQNDESTSESTMASIRSDHAVPRVHYAYENVPKSKARPNPICTVTRDSSSSGWRARPRWSGTTSAASTD